LGLHPRARWGAYNAPDTLCCIQSVLLPTGGGGEKQEKDGKERKEGEGKQRER